MNPSRGTAPPTSGDGGRAPPEFPAGLRVLLVDDDATCLKILERMLRMCLYDVTICSRAAVALSILRENKRRFDLVLSDVYMPDMDGFKLLEHIGLEMDLPVIMMSADDHKDVVMKGVTHGACDYIIKPVRMESLKNIWQHVVRKERNESKEMENSGSLEENDKRKRAAEEVDNASSRCVKMKGEVKEEEEEEEEVVEEHEDSSHSKKPRVVWSIELHQQFVAAVNQLGVDKAVPKKILELMNVPSLTRENVASHLQKYRLYLRRVCMSEHQGRFDAYFTSSQEAIHHSVDSIAGFDLQALAVSAQLPPQSLAALHPGPRNATNTGLGTSRVNQIGFLNTGLQVTNASNIISSSVQQMNNRRVNNLHGHSNNINLSQLGQSQQVVQTYRSINLQFGGGTSGFHSLPSSRPTGFSLPRGISNGQLNMTLHGQQSSLSQQSSSAVISLPGQRQSRGQLVDEIASHDSRFASTSVQQVPSSHILGRQMINAHMDTSLPVNYINASCNMFTTGLAGSCYPPVSSIEGTVESGIVEALIRTANQKGPNDHPPSNDVISELHQNKSNDWKFENVNLPYESGQNLSQEQSAADFHSSSLCHQDSITTAENGDNINAGTDREGTNIDHEQSGCISQNKNTVLVDYSARVNYDRISDISYGDSFGDNIITDELMSVVRTAGRKD